MPGKDSHVSLAALLLSLACVHPGEATHSQLSSDASIPSHLESDNIDEAGNSETKNNVILLRAQTSLLWLVPQPPPPGQGFALTVFRMFFVGSIGIRRGFAMPPEVERRVRMHPPKSVSLNTSRDLALSLKR